MNAKTVLSTPIITSVLPISHSNFGHYHAINVKKLLSLKHNVRATEVMPLKQQQEALKK